MNTKQKKRFTFFTLVLLGVLINIVTNILYNKNDFLIHTQSQYTYLLFFFLIDEINMNTFVWTVVGE